MDIRRPIRSKGIGLKHTENAGVVPSNSALRDAVRPLLLPIEPVYEATAVDALSRCLSDAGLDPEDQPEWLRLEDEVWRTTNIPSELLQKAVRVAISSGIDDEALSLDIADCHFANHSRLTEFAGADHESIRSLLSHTRLVSHLASTERMSATQIARVLNARDRRIQVGWREVAAILQNLSATPSVSPDEVLYLMDEDQRAEQSLFADADDRTVLATVEAAGNRLGFGSGLGSLLAQLLPSDEAPFTPYLQILHYQCSIAEYYDHAVSGAYEFKPRGQAATGLFDRYPESMVEAGNPFLNNAKSVEQLDVNWARSKATQGASALARILERLDGMGFAARKDLAATLRRSIVRKIRAMSEGTVALPEHITPEQLQAILKAVAEKDTETSGILEQRVIDFASSLRHLSSDGWVERGLGDPVNATNLSSKKLGDCDYMDSKARRVVAYEAHGGKVTEVYLYGHMKTLEKTIPVRAEEWLENFGDLGNWRLGVVFIAHSIAADVTRDRVFEIDGVAVRLSVTTFQDFLDQTTADEATAEVATDLILGPLRERRTPGHVREALMKLAAT